MEGALINLSKLTEGQNQVLHKLVEVLCQKTSGRYHYFVDPQNDLIVHCLNVYEL